MIKLTYSFTNALGEKIDVYTLTNALGMEMDVMTGGGRILRLTAPDKNGYFGDVIFGYARPEDYYTREHAYYGAFIGRYGNRIGGAKFTLNGTEYKLTANENGNILHGGKIGYDMKNMTATVDGDKLILSLVSPDGEEGFPGTLTMSVIYELLDDGTLKLTYDATTDKDTVCNLTNHAYFNIGNDDDILDQVLDINSSAITPVDDELIPHDSVMDIDGTPYSFKGGVKLGKNMFSKEHMIALCDGFDFNYCLDRISENDLEFCASVYDEKSGRFMECYTTLPAVQLYTSNRVEGTIGKKVYKNYGALCLETQGYPNSPNCPSYPSTTLKAGEKYHTVTTYKFSVK
ncbi:MAG: galactose mutarotase [Clostridia bacterium]|nr:galactose mutarotase [Clostridia bacterium]